MGEDNQRLGQSTIKVVRVTQGIRILISKTLSNA